VKHILRISFLSSLFLSPLTFAQVPQWQIVPEDSTISFIGTQNDAPVKGEFKKFDGKINFDENNLKESHVSFTVDMNSVMASFKELGSILKAQDWFDATDFPVATFTSSEFTHKDGNHYQVAGQLKIRDKSSPITLMVSVDQNTPDKLLVKGETQIKRTTFGIGQGDWSDTKEIKDDVKVNFNLDLKKAP
jgi:polyisoprenoid-binding protein YceI